MCIQDGSEVIVSLVLWISPSPQDSHRDHLHSSYLGASVAQRTLSAHPARNHSPERTSAKRTVLHPSSEHSHCISLKPAFLFSDKSKEWSLESGKVVEESDDPNDPCRIFPFSLTRRKWNHTIHEMAKEGGMDQGLWASLAGVQHSGVVRGHKASSGSETRQDCSYKQGTFHTSQRLLVQAGFTPFRDLGKVCWNMEW